MYGSFMYKYSFALKITNLEYQRIRYRIRQAMIEFVVSELYVVLFRIWSLGIWLGFSIADFIAVYKNAGSNPERGNS